MSYQRAAHILATQTSQKSRLATTVARSASKLIEGKGRPWQLTHHDKSGCDSRPDEAIALKSAFGQAEAGLLARPLTVSTPRITYSPHPGPWTDSSERGNDRPTQGPASPAKTFDLFAAGRRNNRGVSINSTMRPFSRPQALGRVAAQPQTTDMTTPLCGVRKLAFSLRTP